MQGYNRVTLIGNLGREPELRYTAGGKAVVNLRLAVTTGFGDNAQTDWFNVVAWEKLAEACNQYLAKGRAVLVEGRLRPDEGGNPRVFQRQDGSWGAAFEIVANTVRFLGRREEAAPAEVDIPSYDEGPAEEEIPF